MKLYYSDASPYARKVRVILRELQLTADEVSVNPFDNDPAFVRDNPLGKIPCLVTDEGALFDSDVICDYLISQSGQHLENTQLEDKIAYSAASGILDTAVDRRKELALRNDSTTSEFWLGRYKQAILRTVEWFEARPFGQEINLASLTVAVALEYLEFRHPDLSWQNSAPALDEWYQSIKSRPSLAATRPE